MSPQGQRSIIRLPPRYTSGGQDTSAAKSRSLAREPLPGVRGEVADSRAGTDRRPDITLPCCPASAIVKVGLKLIGLPRPRETSLIGPTILADYRDQLARHIAARPAVPPVEPLPITVWQAMSLLQKAIRRGRTDLALKAAATLLLASPDRLWRRLGTIAFEDIGVADLDTLGLVTVALGGKRVRAKLGGEWPVASLLVEIMAAAPKCRAADDLLFIVQRHPALVEARSRQAELGIHQIRNVALDLVPLPERALALLVRARDGPLPVASPREPSRRAGLRLRPP